MKTLETSRLTFTANVKPLTKFFTTIITAFTLVLKYIKQLLNLWYLTMIQENKLTTSHVFTKAVNYDLAFEVYDWRISFML